MIYFYVFGLLVSNHLMASAYTPKQLAGLAEERAPLIKMQLESRASAMSQISQSKTLANPILTVQSGSLKSGTQSGSVMDVTLNQPLPWPGKRAAAINSSESLKKITEVDLEESKILINHSVTLLSLEIASLIELEKHQDDRKRRFTLIHKFLNTRPIISPKQVIDKELIETQINLVENMMLEFTARKKSLLSQLTVLTGEKDPEILVDWRNASKPYDLDFYIKMMENGPRIKRSVRMQEYANNKVEEAKLVARPDILVGVNYRQENVAPVNHFYHAQVSVVIPILDRGQHTVEIAKANVRREEANKKLVSMETYNLINEHYQNLLAAYRSTIMFKVSDVKTIEKRFVAAEDAFRKGRIDAMTFLQTDTQIHESVDLAYTSYLKYFNSQAQLLGLTGQKMDI